MFPLTKPSSKQTSKQSSRPAYIALTLRKNSKAIQNGIADSIYPYINFTFSIISQCNNKTKNNQYIQLIYNYPSLVFVSISSVQCTGLIMRSVVWFYAAEECLVKVNRKGMRRMERE